MKLALIMLAAGNSRRFGSNKLLYPVEGVPMYLRTLETLLAVKKHFQKAESAKGHGILRCSDDGRMQECNICRITVVTQYEEIGQKALEMGAKVLYNPHPEDGITSSLRIGLEADKAADACLFMVADQPWLMPETVIRLIREFISSGKGIACVSGEEKLGNPCIFSQKYYQELLALNGDKGGKRVIRAHLDDTVVLEVKNIKELFDMDVRDGHPY